MMKHIIPFLFFLAAPILFLNTALGQVPPNDDCAGAITLTPGTTCNPVSGTTENATDNNETGDCVNGTEKAVWFKFMASATAHTVIVDGNFIFDAVIGALTSCGTTVRPIGGNCTDNTFEDDIESLDLSGLTIGATYYIQVHDWYGNTSPNADFTICVTNPPSPPSNDACGNATDLGNTAITINGSNVNATDEGIVDYASCDFSFTGGRNDVWYKFTTNSSGGDATVTFSGSNFDGILAVYTGCNTADEIGCSDDYISLPEVVDLTGLLANTTYYIRISGYEGAQGTFNLSVNGAALPVELLSFSGITEESQNSIKWTVANEKNIDHYLLERSSDGFKDWESVARIKAIGENQIQATYSAQDLYPLASAFYRLVIFEREDVQIPKISNIIHLLRKSEGTQIVRIFPNPATAPNLVVEINAAETSEIVLILTDITGRSIDRLSISLSKGNNRVPVFVEHLAAGAYFLSVEGLDGDHTRMRFIK